MLTLTKEKENDKTPEIQTEKNGFLRISERDTAISALVEHIRKQKLSFFDEASAIERLIRYYGMTQQNWVKHKVHLQINCACSASLPENVKL